MFNNSTDDVRKVGNKSTGVPLMFTSCSLVKELQVSQQKTELTNKTRQNNVHQHTEAAIHGTILKNIIFVRESVNAVPRDQKFYSRDSHIWGQGSAQPECNG